MQKVESIATRIVGADRAASPLTSFIGYSLQRVVVWSQAAARAFKRVALAPLSSILFLLSLIFQSQASSSSCFVTHQQFGQLLCSKMILPSGSRVTSSDERDTHNFFMSFEDRSFIKDPSLTFQVVIKNNEANDKSVASIDPLSASSRSPTLTIKPKAKDDTRRWPPAASSSNAAPSAVEGTEGDQPMWKSRISGVSFD